MHDSDGSLSILFGLELNGANALGTTVLLEHLTEHDITDLVAEQVFQISPATIIRYIAHVDRLLPPILQAELSIQLLMAGPRLPLTGTLTLLLMLLVTVITPARPTIPPIRRSLAASSRRTRTLVAATATPIAVSPISSAAAMII